MPRRFEIVDVFTDRPLAGNQLAVVLDAEGLSTAGMQAIAREFNFAETSFVLPPADAANTAHVRIFTPEIEMPFAGHPNVGTAFVLARAGVSHMRFEEAAGLVEIEIAGDIPWVKAPRALELGHHVPPEIVAELTGLSTADIVTTRFAPQIASVGAGFLLAEVTPAALERASGDAAAFRRHGDIAGVGIHIHARLEQGAYDVRMFAPLSGVPEDPATGSAAAALGAFLHHLDGEAKCVLHQGRHIGRRSRIETEIRDGAVWIGGRCARFAAGELA